MSQKVSVDPTEWFRRRVARELPGWITQILRLANNRD